MSTRPPYSGLQRKLVLSFDIGTTFSGISYWYVSPFCILSVSQIRSSILDPGESPEIKSVTRYVVFRGALLLFLNCLRFPAQEQVGGDSKIPTIIYYDENGEVKAVGAEAMGENLEESVQEEGWTKAEWS